jgi:hypothetical protein
MKLWRTQRGSCGLLNWNKHLVRPLANNWNCQEWSKVESVKKSKFYKCLRYYIVDMGLVIFAICIICILLHSKLQKEMPNWFGQKPTDLERMKATRALQSIASYFRFQEACIPSEILRDDFLMKKGAKYVLGSHDLASSPTSSGMLDMWNTPYFCNGKEGTLSSAGPDRIFGPEDHHNDDIVVSFRNGFCIISTKLKDNRRSVELLFSKPVKKSSFLKDEIYIPNYHGKKEDWIKIENIRFNNENGNIFIVQLDFNQSLRENNTYILVIDCKILASDNTSIPPAISIQIQPEQSPDNTRLRKDCFLRCSANNNRKKDNEHQEIVETPKPFGD